MTNHKNLVFSLEFFRLPNIVVFRKANHKDLMFSSTAFAIAK